jgi:hypothetical protein
VNPERIHVIRVEDAPAQQPYVLGGSDSMTVMKFDTLAGADAGE